MLTKKTFENFQWVIRFNSERQEAHGAHDDAVVWLPNIIVITSLNLCSVCISSVLCFVSDSPEFFFHLATATMVSIPVRLFHFDFVCNYCNCYIVTFTLFGSFNYRKTPAVKMYFFGLLSVWLFGIWSNCSKFVQGSLKPWTCFNFPKCDTN